MMPFVHSFKFANNVPKKGIGYIAMFSKIALYIAKAVLDRCAVL